VKDGLRLVEPNENLATSFMTTADDFLGTMNRERNYNMKAALSAAYYSMYNALYAVLSKIGLKCEIHACTIECIPSLLSDYYSKEDLVIIKKGLEAREIAHYRADEIVTENDKDFVLKQTPFFLSKSKEVLATLNEKDIEVIRKKLKPYKK
jgi:uncharacterized protein (UPF0332 family)